MECMELKARIEKTDRKFITIDLFSTKKKKKRERFSRLHFMLIALVRILTMLYTEMYLYTALVESYPISSNICNLW